MSEFKLADTINVSVDKAKEIISMFFAVVPNVKKFLDMLGTLGRKRGYIRSAPPYRRIRWFPEWKEDIDPKKDFKILGSIERKAKNMPIQGSNADIIKQALINVQNEIDTNNWPVNILLSIYDEIVTECKEEKSHEWKDKLEEIMISTAREVLKKVPIKADCAVSDYWKK
jgi:DNA polymerase-1